MSGNGIAFPMWGVQCSMTILHGWCKKERCWFRIYYLRTKLIRYQHWKRIDRSSNRIAFEMCSTQSPIANASGIALNSWV